MHHASSCRSKKKSSKVRNFLLKLKLSIVNHLLGLGKTFEDDELNIKILNFLSSTWEPKIKVIKESKDLASMSMEALFEKLLAYEHEFIQQSGAEKTKKRNEKELHSKLNLQRKITKKVPVMMKIQRISA